MKKTLAFMILSITIISCHPQKQISYLESYRNYNKISEQFNAYEMKVALPKFDSLTALIYHMQSNHFFNIAQACCEIEYAYHLKERRSLNSSLSTYKFYKSYAFFL